MTDSPRGRSYGGRDDESRRSARRIRLLEAAFELFGDPSGSPASVERICSRASVATRSIYEEFGGRNQLLLAVHDEVIDATRAAVDMGIERAPRSSEARTRAAVKAYVMFLTTDPRRARVAHLPMPPSGVTSQRRPPAAALVDRLVDAPSTSAEGRRLTVIALMGAVNELLLDWSQTASPDAVPDLIDEITHLATSVLAARDEQVRTS